jgi:hypothetical protein
MGVTFPFIPEKLRGGRTEPSTGLIEINARNTKPCDA